MPEDQDQPVTDTPTQEAKYTDADMQRAITTRVSKEQKKYEAQLAELQAKAAKADELEQRMQQLEEEREMAGKNATEQAQLKSQKELDKLRREIEERDKRIGEVSAREAQALNALRTDRATNKVMAALSSEKAINAERAARYAMTDIAITHHDDGSITASYGDAEDVSVTDAVKAWLKDNDNFLPAPAGGAGTRQGGHAGSKPLHELSPAELMQLSRTQR